MLIEFGDRNTELAVSELGLQMSLVQHQVGTVQRYAVRDSEKARCHHCDPTAEIAVMNVDMFNAGASQ